MSFWTERERRLARALAHAVKRNHPLDPARCNGCLEVAGFLAVPGYDGDTAYPTCATVEFYRDESRGLKHTRW